VEGRGKDRGFNPLLEVVSSLDWRFDPPLNLEVVASLNWRFVPPLNLEELSSLGIHYFPLTITYDYFSYMVHGVLVYLFYYSSLFIGYFSLLIGYKLNL
jgi:hypothetical protein